MIEITRYYADCLERCFEIFTKAHPQEDVSYNRFIRNTVLDLNFKPESFFVAKINEKIVGFIYAPYRIYAVSKEGIKDGNMGFVTMLSVEPGFNIEEVGGALLEKAEEYHVQNGRTYITTAYAPMYINQGVESSEKEMTDLYSSHGYASSQSAARKLLLKDRVPNEKYESVSKHLKEDGIYVGKLLPQYAYSYLNEEAKYSSSGWAHEFRVRLEEKLDFDSVQVAVKDGEVIGACVFGDPGSDAQRFGPFGVDAQYRGRGIGGILLENTLAEMEKRGLEYAWMQWTPLSGAANAIYEKFGFKVNKIYHTFTKKV